MTDYISYKGKKIAEGTPAFLLVMAALLLPFCIGFVCGAILG